MSQQSMIRRPSSRQTNLSGNENKGSPTVVLNGYTAIKYDAFYLPRPLNLCPKPQIGNPRRYIQLLSRNHRGQDWNAQYIYIYIYMIKPAELPL